jgi:hypothetical protein
MMKGMEKLLSKEEGQMSDVEKRAKMKALAEIKAFIMEQMGSELEMPQEMQKVSVMAGDKDGLMEGLDKAEDLLEQMPEKPGMEGMSEEEDEESY